MKFIKPLLLAVLAATTLCAQAAKYNGEDRGRPVMPAQAHAKWQTECSGCHMAFQPGLLPADSWTKIMSGLDKHFGTDASLAPKDTQEIADYLTKHASNRWSASTAPLRITESQWWKSKHSEVRAAVWTRESVKSHANCMACHRAADKGDFDEDNVRIPK